MAKTLTLKNLPESLGPHSFDPAEIDAFKREGLRLLRSIASLEASHEQSRGLESTSSQPDPRAC